MKMLDINSEQLSLIESAVGVLFACWLQPGEREWKGRNACVNQNDNYYFC